MDPGTVLRGKYRIERRLGSGGMGEVLLATHLRLGQRVAIKILQASALAKPDMVERFGREARAAATLTGDHVVRILDVDETEERVPFFVMEYLIGADLEVVLGRDGPLAVVRAVDLVLDACEALAEAHAAGIVHRDLKPANLFLTKRSSGAEIVKVLDFGISKAIAASETSVSLTTTQTVIGSPLYMSPEQLRASRAVDARSDVWSLGVVLYQLLTNQLPFTGTSATAVAACIAADPPAPLRALRADVPIALEQVILRCLTKAPAERFGSMVELAEALAPFGTTPERASAVANAAKPRSGSQPRVTSPTAATELARGRRTETLPGVTGAASQQGASTESSSVASFRPPPRPPAPRRVGVAITVVLMGAALVSIALLRSTPTPKVSGTPDGTSPASPESPSGDHEARRGRNQIVLSTNAPPEPRASSPAPEPATASAPTPVPSAATTTRTPSPPAARAPTSDKATPLRRAEPPPRHVAAPSSASARDPLDVDIK